MAQVQHWVFLPGSPWASTAPRWLADALHFYQQILTEIRNFVEQGKNKNWLRLWKAASQSSNQGWESLSYFPVSAVSGPAIVANCGMNPLYQRTSPRKDHRAVPLSTCRCTSPCLRWYPRYHVSCHAHSHFVGLRVKPAWGPGEVNQLKMGKLHELNLQGVFYRQKWTICKINA